MILAQLATEVRYQIYAALILNRPILPAPKLDSAPARPFTIADPYNHPGAYRKAQLHLHTSNSKDVRPKIPVADAIEKYTRRGYQFLAITDHEMVTDCSNLSSPGLTVIPGVEETIVFLFWPLGKHLVHIGADKTSATNQSGATESVPGSKFTSALNLTAHPNWQGNLGTGRWYLKELLQFPNLQLLEIFNHHSNSASDIQLWTQLLHRCDPQNPVWAVAVDDSDNGERIDQGWIMIKTPDLTSTSFISALKSGSFYATTGVLADFRVEAGIIKVSSENGTEIRFINHQNRIICASTSNHSQYQPQGDEVYIRVEIANPQGQTAWSQPFFLMPKNQP